MPKKKEVTVDTPSGAYLAMQNNLMLVNTLIAGTDAMREAGELYLPREPKESKEAYDNRLSRSVLHNAFADAIQKLVGKPFSKPVTLKENTPDQIKDWTEDIDRCGNNITTFARDVFEQALADGLTHILVDFPPSDPERSLADEQAEETRPYAVHIKAEDLFAWNFATINGVKELTQIRIRETTTEQDGLWGEKLVQRIRVIYPDRFELYELNKDNKWMLIDTAEITLGRIALVTFYTGRTGFMTAKPPLLDLAHLNVQHWQSDSDQEHILHFIRFPLLHGAGFNQEQQQIEIGPNRMIMSEDVQSRLEYVEHSGAAVEAGRQSLRDKEEKMDAMGSQLLVRRPGDVTATSDALSTAKTDSALQDMVRRLENVFSEVFFLMAGWAGLDSEESGGISINQDFGLSMVTGSDDDTLLRARMAGEISQETYLSELKRRGKLNEDLDVDDEIERTPTEGGNFDDEET